MITITDIANKAGVSRATVSYVLNGQNTTVRISDVTRQRVMEVATELGYRRNQLARAVITGQTRMLGLWVMQSQHEPVARILSGLMSEADANDFFVKLVGFDEFDGQLSVSRVVERCIEWRLAGIVAIHAPEAALDALQPSLGDLNVPLVIVDSQAARPGVAHIASNQESAILDVIAHLKSLGHRRIAFIAGRPDPEELLSRRRVEAYEHAMRQLDLISEIAVHYGQWDAESTARLTEFLLSAPAAERPTAIGCWSDLTAMTVVQTAARMGLRIPQDISVTGFDDSRAAALYNPPLTTVAQDFEEMGRQALRKLLARTNPAWSAPEESEEVQLATELVVRESSGPANPAQ